LYRYITDKIERRAAVLKVADNIYPHIAQTTDEILRFNDKYEGADLLEDENNLLEVLDTDLSSLGEILAERIQLEDKVISALTGQIH
jgi:regulator of sigma D